MPLLRYQARLYEATVEAAEMLRAYLTPIPLDYEPYQKQVATYFVKAYKTYRATYLLIADGFDEDALCLNRCNFEILFNIGFLLEGDPNPQAKTKGDSIEARSERILEHNYLARMQHYLEVKEFKSIYSRRKKLNGYFDLAIKKHEDSNDWDEVLAAYRKRPKSKSGDRNIPHYWTESGARSFCKWMDKKPKKALNIKGMKFPYQFWAEEYLSVYKEASVFIHSLGLSLEFYIEERNGQLYFTFDETINTVNNRNHLRDASTILVAIILYTVHSFGFQDDDLSNACRRVLELRAQKLADESVPTS